MKKILVFALFIVAWQTFEPKMTNKDLLWSKNQKDYSCVVTNHTEFFDDEMKARLRWVDLDMTNGVINVKMYDAREVGNQAKKENP